MNLNTLFWFSTQHLLGFHSISKIVVLEGKGLDFNY